MRKPYWEYIIREFPQFNALVDLQHTKGWSLVWNNGGLLKKLNTVLEQLEDPNNEHMLMNANKTKLLNPVVASIYVTFGMDGAKIYKFAREFGEELAKVTLDLECGLVPLQHKPICIEFPDNIRFKMGNEYAHCVFMCVTDEKAITRNGRLAKRSIHFVSPLFSENGILLEEVTNQFCVVCEDDKELFSQAVEKSYKNSTDKNYNKAYVQFCLNALLYVHSGEPDLRQYRSPKPPLTRKPKEIRRWNKAHENISLLDMTLVGFNFKKPTEYTMDSTAVRGHFRWQPYGAQRSLVKLIWIVAHMREFKKEVTHA